MNIVAPKDAATRSGSQPEQDALPLPLQQALECLPVNIDEELMRYRRAIHGDTVPGPARRLGMRRRRRGLDLIKVEAQTKATVPPAQASTRAAATATVAPPPPLPNPKVAAAEADRSDMPQVTGPLAPYEPVPQDYLETTEALLNFDRESTASSPEEAYAPSLAQRLSTPLGLGSLLLLLFGCGGLGYLLTNPRAVQHLWQHPIVQTWRGQPQGEVADKGAAVADPTSVPLRGMGPDLSQREFADLDLNDLSTLSPATRDRMASTPVTTTVAPEQLSPEAATDSTDNGAAGEAPAAAASDPAAEPRAAAPDNPAASTAPRTVVQPLVRAQPTTPPRSTAPATPAAPQPSPEAATPTPPAPLTPGTTPNQEPVAAAPSVQPNYYVVTSYTGDQSLDEARRIVNGAYVRNFPEGARIQMGAFNQESSAQELINQLQNQGIPAQIYQP